LAAFVVGIFSRAFKEQLEKNLISAYPWLGHILFDMNKGGYDAKNHRSSRRFPVCCFSQ
jgi:hypothetical protein